MGLFEIGHFETFDGPMNPQYPLKSIIYMTVKNTIHFIMTIIIFSQTANKILASIKGHNSDTNVRKMTVNNLNLDLVNINAHTKIGEILSICSQDIERTRKCDVIQGP